MINRWEIADLLIFGLAIAITYIYLFLFALKRIFGGFCFIVYQLLAVLFQLFLKGFVLYYTVLSFYFYFIYSPHSYCFFIFFVRFQLDFPLLSFSLSLFIAFPIIFLWLPYGTLFFLILFSLYLLYIIIIDGLLSA